MPRGPATPVRDSYPIGGEAQHLFIEGCIEVLPAIKYTEYGYGFTCNFESNADAPPEAEDSQTRANIIPPRTPHRKGLQALTLLHNRIGIEPVS